MRVRLRSRPVDVGRSAQRLHAELRPFVVMPRPSLHGRSRALADFAVSCRSNHSRASAATLWRQSSAGETGQLRAFDRSGQFVDNCRSGMTNVKAVALPQTAGCASSSDGCVDRLMCAFDHAPDSFICAAHKSSGDNRLASGATIVLKCERAVALCDTDQREVVLPLNINGTAVNVGTSIAYFHGASRLGAQAQRLTFASIVQKKPARGGPRLMHPLRRQRGQI